MTVFVFNGGDFAVKTANRDKLAVAVGFFVISDGFMIIRIQFIMGKVDALQYGAVTAYRPNISDDRRSGKYLETVFIIAICVESKRISVSAFKLNFRSAESLS